ncbi:MAG TPA: PAS domain S-box protein [Methanolinea sp.]|nr:PAS domain S-box protein [Methanolinea sp.]
MSRPSTAKYLNILVAKGQAEMRQYGRAKVYSLCERIPVNHMLSLSSDLILIMDRNLFITQANDQFLSFFRLEKPDITGKSFEFSPVAGTIPIDTGTLKAVLDGRDYIQDIQVEFEDRLYYFRARVVPLIFESEDLGIALILQDITSLMRSHHELEDLVKERTRELLATNKRLIQEIQNHRKMEKRLTESEKKYRTLIETIHEGIMALDHEGIITFVNPRMASMLGYTPEMMTGRHLFTYLDDQGVTGLRELFKEAAVFPKMVDLRLIRADTTRIHVLFSFSRIDDPEENQSGIIAGVIDISDRILLEQALLQTGKKLSLLSSVTRHDVLNLLNILQGTLSLLEQSNNDTEKVILLEKARNTASRIEKQMLFSREFKEVGMAAPRWLDTGEILQRALMTLDLERLKVQNDLHGLEVYADSMIEKVFSNLIDNTIRHGQGATNIRFRREVRDACQVIIAEDDGKGVPENLKGIIFEQHFGRNHGLGLFLVREILSIYGMSITETGTYGKGARFEITVPEGIYRQVFPR